MKRFIVSVLCVSAFFIGLGALADKVGASFKSDEKALALIKQSRLAIGGDQSIAEIRSLAIIGKTTYNFTFDGLTRTEQGETEIALQLPDKLMKMVRIGNPDAALNGEKIRKEVDVLVTGDGAAHDFIFERKDSAASEGQKLRIKRHGDGEARMMLWGKDGEFITEDGKKILVHKIESSEGSGGEHRGMVRKDEADVVEFRAQNGGNGIPHDKIRKAHEGMRQNELLRTTLGLLLLAPEGMEVSYTFAGEGDIDGTGVNIVNAEFAGSSVKLYLSKASSLPVAISFTGHRTPKIAKFHKEIAPPADGAKDTVAFVRKMEGPGENAEFMIKFSDYRSVNGVQLPYRWTTTVAGKTEEVFDVTSYDVNPANIADKFQNEKVFVRTKNGH